VAASAAPGLSKKEAKAAVAKSSARIAEMFGYTAEENPFGDTNLTDTFVWKKKIDKEITSGARARAPTKTEQILEREALMTEIERAKERRLQREREAEEMERLRAEEARLRDASEYADWERKEEEFQLRQARARCFVRIREGREKPVDVLLKNLLLVEAVQQLSEEGTGTHGVSAGDLEGANAALLGEVELAPPSRVFASLEIVELQDLEADLQLFVQLQQQAGAATDSRGGAYLSALTAVCAAELSRAQSRESGLAAGQSLSSLRLVEEEVDAMFRGQSEAQLRDMEAAVRGNIARGQQVHSGGFASARGAGGDMPGGMAAAGGFASPVIDVEYWEKVLRQLQVAKARAALQRLHEELLLHRLQQLDELRKTTPAAAPAVTDADADTGEWESAAGAGDGKAAGRHAGAASEEVAAALSTRQSAIDARIRSLRHRGLLPPPGAGSLFWRDRERHPAAAAEDTAAAAAGAGGGGGDHEEALVVGDDGRALPTGAAEAEFGATAEVSLPGAAAAAAKEAAVAAAREGCSAMRSSTPAAGSGAASHRTRGSGAGGMDAATAALLEDKYRPRKPRYFNRVKTGYDWNKYNQTHYDHDNPPPKTVQGYKFNIFYPDLLDRTRTPKFFLEPADSDEYCIIRFHAGPPYEDVAFKIVNKEWEYARKHGFRCVFDRGILQLHFNFKRHRYRK